MNVELGTRVEGRWGMMHPTSQGVIASITDTGAIIAWDEGGQHHVAINDIHEVGYTSPNGSPIGIFIQQNINS